MGVAGVSRLELLRDWIWYTTCFHDFLYLLIFQPLQIRFVCSFPVIVSRIVDTPLSCVKLAPYFSKYLSWFSQTIAM